MDSGEQLARLLPWFRQECSAGRSRYIEIRGIEQDSMDSGFSESARFHLHKFDLRADRDEILHRLHASCIRRRLARALRAGFVSEEGRSEALLAKFYQLAALTRRRQKLPPQPLVWFRNLIDCLGEELVEFDMGRSKWGNEGLAGFKDRWGCTRSGIVYSRYPAHRIQHEAENLARRAAKRLFAVAPDNLLTAAGNVLYRHMA